MGCTLTTLRGHEIKIEAVFFLFFSTADSVPYSELWFFIFLCVIAEPFCLLGECWPTSHPRFRSWGYLGDLSSWIFVRVVRSYHALISWQNFAELQLTLIRNWLSGGLCSVTIAAGFFFFGGGESDFFPSQLGWYIYKQITGKKTPIKNRQGKQRQWKTCIVMLII